MPHDDFQVEPVRGLPEAPPEGERILWQGAPTTWALARESLSLYWVAAYFALLAVWRGLANADPMAMVPYLLMGAVTCGILLLLAWVFAVTTVYTITNRRVAMRIGAALTVTLNIPFTRIEGADLEKRKDGSGNIALRLLGGTQISYLVCWPHVRPWRMKKTQPALRAIRDADRVAEILADAAHARVSEVNTRDLDAAMDAAATVAAE